MERSVLERWGELARVNLFQTYCDLAAGAKGTIIEKRVGYTRVTGDPAVSFCNFCALFDATEDQLVDLLPTLHTYGEESSNFWVFVTDFCRPPSLRWHLLQAGFECRQSMDLMIWAGDSVTVTEAAVEAISTAERLSVTQFMTDIFFSRTSAAARTTVMESTSSSPHRIFAWNDRSGIVAAVMTSTSEKVYGLYNLGVRSDRRGRGLGVNAVDFVKSLAAAEERAVVLQCHSNLTDWYKEQGFEVIGQVDAYSVPDRSWGAMV